MSRAHVVLLSTSVGPLGSGIGGGVELTIASLAAGLVDLGVEVTVVAPAGSRPLPAPVRTIGVPGGLQVSSQTTDRATPITMPVAPVLGAMADRARRLLDGPDPPEVVINLAYDWLPLFLTPWMPLVHLVSMGSLNDAIDEALGRALEVRPGCAAVHSHAQAATFGPLAGALQVVGNGFDLSPYRVHDTPGDHLAWVGRISPEKALHHAVATAEQVGLPLVVYGFLQDEAYFRACLAAHPRAVVHHAGFLPTAELGRRLGAARALLVTPTWIEAFGNVVVEALACGVPVVAYDRGGPADIVTDGVTGFVVPPDDVDALAAAVERIGVIDRHACRADAEARFDRVPFAARVLAWARAALTTPVTPGRPGPSAG